jgi:predicted aminopeptidase
VPDNAYFAVDAPPPAERQLTAEGFDARLGAAAAFSTLGWFNDPLLPTTLRADTLSVANTVIHELTHNTFYAPGGAVFNESFANFVGSRGAERFFASRGQHAAARAVALRWEDEKIIGRFWASLCARFDSAFKALPGEDSARVAARIAARDSIYGAARLTLRDTVAPQLRTMKIGNAQRVRIDNAVLMARRVYLTDLDAFDAVLARRGGDLRGAIAAIIDAAKADRKQPFDAVRALSGVAAAR